jgi:uncharacterized protein (DUF952 family)
MQVNNPTATLSLVARSGFTAAAGARTPRTSARHRRNVATTIYKICERARWREAEGAGVFGGAAVDLRDGFIHFSTADQVRETAARHFAGAADLMLVAVDAVALGGALKWEVSRGGDLFPHLYGALPLAAVLWARPLPLGGDGEHVFPEFEP